MMTEIEKHITAILDLMTCKNDLDQMIFDINHLIDKISYKTIGDNGGENHQKKKELISYEVGKLGCESLQKYFQRLLEKDDIWLFEPAHYKFFAEEFQSRSQATTFFQVTVAANLKQEDLKIIADKLSDKMQRRVIVDMRVDKNIIGGTIIKKDNFILDYSLRTKLNNLSDKWKESISSGVRK